MTDQHTREMPAAQTSSPTATQLGLRTVLCVAVVSLIVGLLLGETGLVLAWAPLVAGVVVTVVTALWRAV